MKSEISVTFSEREVFRIDLDHAEPMTGEAAQAWLDGQFLALGCEPLRPTGKVLRADKVLVVAKAAGVSRFEDAAWAQQFARAAAASLGKSVVNVDVPGMTLGF